MSDDPRSVTSNQNTQPSNLPQLLRDAERRVNEHVWGDRRAIVSIPADVTRDVDILLLTAADQVEAMASVGLRHEREIERLRAALQRTVDEGDYTAPESMKRIARDALSGNSSVSETTVALSTYESAVKGRQDFRAALVAERNKVIGLRTALEHAVQWGGPMAEAPPDSRPAWFDIARAALAATASSAEETAIHAPLTWELFWRQVRENNFEPTPEDLRDLLRAITPESPEETSVSQQIRELINAASQPPVEWGCVRGKTVDQHVADFRDSLSWYTAIGTDLHGVYLGGTETVVCHTGNGPHSEANARLITFALNNLGNLVDEIERLRTALQVARDELVQYIDFQRKSDYLEYAAESQKKLDAVNAALSGDSSALHDEHCDVNDLIIKGKPCNCRNRVLGLPDETSALPDVLRGLIDAVRSVNIDRREWYTHIAQPLQDAYRALGSSGPGLTPEEIAALRDGI